ncbi:MAG: hypothetical protein HOP07_00490 [Bacteriovoracaceae bacterium]|nr:hypothetical protein [Bacteriovoracaceae bacterium]
MKENNSPIINYIFYLQTKEELDRTFYLLAEVLRKINISLLPIESHELKNLDKSKKNHLIVLRNDFSSAFAFNDLKKEFLDSSMASNKVMVYDVSSFSEIENAVKLENKNVYRFFQLPLNVNQIAMTIAVEFFKDRNTQVEWPGGRRAKLPSMTNSN